jgi:hypothetical protein
MLGLRSAAGHFGGSATADMGGTALPLTGLGPASGLSVTADFTQRLVYIHVYADEH